MTYHIPTRADDEALLHMLALRRTHTSAEIGKAFGTSQEFVRVKTSKIIREDSKAEGRDTRGAYEFLDNSTAIRIGMGG